MSDVVKVGDKVRVTGSPDGTWKNYAGSVVSVEEVDDPIGDEMPFVRARFEDDGFLGYFSGDAYELIEQNTPDEDLPPADTLTGHLLDLYSADRMSQQAERQYKYAIDAIKAQEPIDGFAYAFMDGDYRMVCIFNESGSPSFHKVIE